MSRYVPFHFERTTKARGAQKRKLLLSQLNENRERNVDEGERAGEWIWKWNSIEQLIVSKWKTRNVIGAENKSGACRSVRRFAQSTIRFLISPARRISPKKCRIGAGFHVPSSYRPRGGNLINWLRRRNGKRQIIDQTMRHLGSIFNFAVYGLILEVLSDFGCGRAVPPFGAVEADAQQHVSVMQSCDNPVLDGEKASGTGKQFKRQKEMN